MKKKICKRCGEETYLYARKMCKTCDRIENPHKHGLKQNVISSNDPFSASLSEENEVGKGRVQFKNRKPLRGKKPNIKSLNKDHIRNTLEKKLDEVFSEYSRLYYSDKDGYCKCYTCGKKGFYKGDTIQCGHHLVRNFYGGRWNLKNTKPQCLHCNYGFNDIDVDKVYKEKMILEMGKLEYEEFTRQIRQEAKFSIEDLEIMLQDFKDELKFLKKEKRLK